MHFFLLMVYAYFNAKLVCSIFSVTMIDVCIVWITQMLKLPTPEWMHESQTLVQL